MPLPADWASWPIIAGEVGPKTVTKKRQGGLDIETTRQPLGPFILEYKSYDKQISGGYEILEADCAGSGISPMSNGEIQFYMVGTSSLRQRDNVFVMIVRGPMKELPVAFARR